jgi:hypothetical protein
VAACLRPAGLMSRGEEFEEKEATIVRRIYRSTYSHTEELLRHRLDQLLDQHPYEDAVEVMFGELEGET